MTFATRELERIEARALAALRFVDAVTGGTVDTRLRLIAPEGTDIFRNRSGLYVVRAHAPLAAHSAAFFEPPALPALGSIPLTVEVHDDSGRYLPRVAHLMLPRDARPEEAHTPASLFQPVAIELYRSPVAALTANWAALTVSLTETTSGDALGGALLRVDSGGETLARGLTDWRGEALVPVAGIPVTTWSDADDAVIANDIEATLEVVFDTACGSVRTSRDALRAGRPPTRLPVADPEALAASASAARAATTMRLAAGSSLALPINLGLPG